MCGLEGRRIIDLGVRGSLHVGIIIVVHAEILSCT